jgi:transcriptional regulator with XRE-family HTH domain
MTSFWSGYALQGYKELFLGLADRIRAERERLGLSQEEAAHKLSVSRFTYQQLETAANPPASTLLALVRVLGMDLAALLPEVTGAVQQPTRDYGESQAITEIGATEDMLGAQT